jgi:hypothetical protein
MAAQMTIQEERLRIGLNSRGESFVEPLLDEMAGFTGRGSLSS